uniref:Putative reverse transcriptase domain-containing protein n=1 Tax=Tanacetum cinerariifolium TaxID=118510 RepID=A0A699I0J7_TANCI|nr:putative reverse transcriptase domain-containing protein [Tanacetum cinerariifolium]
MTVVTNEDNELVPTRTVIGWRVCIDYHKLNEATQKDHFSLPFTDQMLDRLAGNKFFCFLDGFSGYFWIPFEPADQEKTTFTCSYGTYAYKRMPFGLCNAPATFQRCMIAIFQDMLETSMEVFMDDFLVFRDSFNSCLTNLKQTHIHYKQAHLVLNWEKCHFMVTERIVLGHKVSSKGLEVDKAKTDVIAKLPPPTNEEEINDEFPEKFLMSSSTDEKESPWFADFAIFRGILRKGLTYAQRCKFFSQLKHYFWDEPYLFKACLDGMIRRCVYGSETRKILDECHHGPTEGNYGPLITAKKVFDAGFYWPTIFKEAQNLVQNCVACQRSGSISRRDETPLNSI